ncbi:IMPACT family protein [Orrella marina]|uniref:IMPACT family protein n=1 Tax=Orrella marina TaxID=2163011 RepID=A0A2R4XKA9_9BURK|nr:YigZ family protein [Orrella marina]AWB34213.1 IMPACT family protein [Orrella marina]
MSMSISETGRSELIIKKSRFIGMVCPVDSRKQAVQVISELKAEHPSAAHICWALMAGGDSAAVDDGEPSGTAGRPMLEVLRHQNLEGVLATVVRYYGGVKLGAGGLVRAYTDAVVQALASTTPVERIQWSRIRCRVPYAHEGTVRQEITIHDAEIEHAGHTEDVLLVIRVPRQYVGRLKSAIDNLSHGRTIWDD